MSEMSLRKSTVMDRVPAMSLRKSTVMDRVPARNYTQSGLRSVRELKNEFRTLANLIADDEDDFCEIEVFDRLSSTVSALRRRKFDLQEKNSKKTLKPRRPLSEELESLSVPECFLCPISSQIMTDPVILATGETYDRPYIQRWLDADHRTCPKTQQELPHVILTPNYLVRSMIEQWCESQGLDYPSRTSIVQGDGIMPHETKYLNILFDKLSGHYLLSQQREAVWELRALTKKKHSHRVYLGQPRTIALLTPLLQSDDPKTQEHTVTAFFNLSIHHANKALIAKEGAIVPLVKVLRSGLTMAARENAAATLFSLSALDENKAKIGASGAIPALVELLKVGKSRGKTDAASALFNLCICPENRGAAVKTGLVAVLFKMIGNEKDGMRDESLAILALLAGHREGAAAIAEVAGFIPILMAFIKKTTSSASASCTSNSTENAVVILAALCGHNPSTVKELQSNDGYIKALVSLSMGSSHRSRRKAAAIVEHIMKQIQAEELPGSNRRPELRPAPPLSVSASVNRVNKGSNIDKEDVDIHDAQKTVKTSAMKRKSFFSPLVEKSLTGKVKWLDQTFGDNLRTLEVPMRTLGVASSRSQARCTSNVLRSAKGTVLSPSNIPVSRRHKSAPAVADVASAETVSAVSNVLRSAKGTVLPPNNIPVSRRHKSAPAVADVASAETVSAVSRDVATGSSTPSYPMSMRRL